MRDFKRFFNDFKSSVSEYCDFRIGNYDEFTKWISEIFAPVYNDVGLKDFIRNEFKEILNKVIYLGTGQITITEDLVLQTIFNLSLKRSFEDSFTFINSLKSGYDLYYYVPIMGFWRAIDAEKILLTDEIEIINTTQLEFSRFKSDLVKKRIDSVLRVRVGHFDLCNKSDINKTIEIETSITQVQEKLQRIFPVLPIALGNGCIPYHETTFAASDMIFANELLLMQGNIKKNINANFYGINRLSNDDINKVVIDKCLDLPEYLFNYILPALTYYNKYLICADGQYADAAIFLRTFLESLLIDGYGAKKSPVSHRAAFLLNSNMASVTNCTDNCCEYINCVKQFSMIYSVCSSFIHGDSFYEQHGPFDRAVEDGFIQVIKPELRELIINYINILHTNQSNLITEKNINDIIFRNPIKNIAIASSCIYKKDRMKECIGYKKLDDYVVQLVKFETNGLHIHRKMYLKMLFSQLVSKVFGTKILTDLDTIPPKFPMLKTSTQMFITGLIENYYNKISLPLTATWINTFTAPSSWLDIDGKTLEINDDSMFPTHFKNRKLALKLEL